MDILEFTDIFLPQLAASYVRGELPLHALVDFDLWKQIFPDQRQTSSRQFLWYQIKFTCNRLADGTLLLSFVLPEPGNKRDPKFAAIRIDLQAEGERRANYYVLRKPGSIFDQWDIHHLCLTPESDKTELSFKCKIDGTDSLRNFIITVQQIPFIEAEEDNSLFRSVKQFFRDAISTQK